MFVISKLKSALKVSAVAICLSAVASASAQTDPAYPCASLTSADWLTGEQLALVTGVDRARDRTLRMIKRAEDAGENDGAILAGIIDQFGQVGMGRNDRIAGKYKCRKLQTDGELNIVYGYFSCIIRDLGEGFLDVEKLSGSQRFLGDLRRLAIFGDDLDAEPTGHLAYNGMYFSGGDQPRSWDRQSTDSQVGCMMGIGPGIQGREGTDGRMVLVLPPQQGYRSFVAWEFVPE